MWSLKGPILFCEKEVNFLSSFSSDSSSKLDILGHDGNSFGMDSAQVGIFKKTNQVSFRSFLESHNSRRLETEISFEILSNFSDQTLEGQLSDQQFSGFLVSSDFSKSNCSGSISVGFLNSTSSRGRFSGGFGSQLFSGSFSTSGFSAVCLVRAIFSVQTSKVE